MDHPASLPSQTYSFELQNHTLSLVLSEKEVIKMDFFHKQGGKSFDLIINQESMTQNVVLLEFFEYPSTLFKDIAANINTVTLSPQGLVSFSMPFRNRQKEFKFQAKEKTMTPRDKMIGQMKLENEKRFRCLEEEIKLLRKQMKDKVEVSKHQQVSETTAMEMMKLKDDSHNIQKTMKEQFEQSQQHIQKQLQVQQDRLNQHKLEYLRQIATLKAQLQDTCVKFRGLREDKQRETINLKKEFLDACTTIDLKHHQNQASLAIVSKQIANIYQIIWMLNEKSQNNISAFNQESNLANNLLTLENNNKYICQKVQSSLKLKYKNNGSYYGFLRPVALQVGSITKLNLKQIKTNVKNIMYGISTDKTMGMLNPYSHLECKAYYARNGHVYENGDPRAGGCAISDGSSVTITADLINWRITWEMNGNLLASADISPAMKANKLYFIIVMYNQNDEVEIIGN